MVAIFKATSIQTATHRRCVNGGSKTNDFMTKGCRRGMRVCLKSIGSEQSKQRCRNSQKDEGPRWHSCRNNIGREQRQSDHAGQKCPSDIHQDKGTGRYHNELTVMYYEEVSSTDNIIKPMIASTKNPTMFSRERLLSMTTDINRASAAPHHAVPAT